MHNAALWAVARGLIRGRLLRDPRLERTIFGIPFPNPLGLAAGFDKNAIAVDRWEALGFGFAEIGTATYHAQAGNDKPRLFRLPESQALINRLGFNNQGAAVIAGRLKSNRPTIPIGANLGKSKITSLDEAVSDYESSFRLLAPHAAYITVNVSSPNTPGLRELQEPSRLSDLLESLKSIDSEKPILVKIAPDLEDGQIDAILENAVAAGAAGIIATNTTTDRSGIRSSIPDGGVSGRPLFASSNAVLRRLAGSRPAGFVLIGVGGIFTGQDMAEKMRIGADLCQIYTGWVYRGPSAAARILTDFLALPRENDAAHDNLLR